MEVTFGNRFREKYDAVMKDPHLSAAGKRAAVEKLLVEAEHQYEIHVAETEQRLRDQQTSRKMSTTIKPPKNSLPQLFTIFTDDHENEFQLKMLKAFSTIGALLAEQRVVDLMVAAASRISDGGQLTRKLQEIIDIEPNSEGALLRATPQILSVASSWEGPDGALSRNTVQTWLASKTGELEKSNISPQQREFYAQREALEAEASEKAGAAMLERMTAQNVWSDLQSFRPLPGSDQ